MPADGVVAPIASFENAARNPPTRPLTARVSSTSRPPTRASNDDDARLHAIEHSIASRQKAGLHCNIQYLEAPRTVARRPQPPPALGPPICHHHHTTKKLNPQCIDLGRAIHTKQNSTFALIPQPSVTDLPAKVQSHHLAHASVCMTLARQASVNGRKSARLKDCSKVRPTIAASGFPPACLVEAASRDVSDRPVATFSTVLARVPTPACALSDLPVIYDVVVQDLARCLGVRM